MHGISCSFAPRLSAAAAPAAGLAAPLPGMRNLLPLDSPANAFGRGQLGHVQLRSLMRKLSARIAREPNWPDVLEHATSPEDNPTIPSGYTYLLQFVAHDIVSTSVSLAATGGLQFGFENARVQPLVLDTIYGGGPNLCPHAYEFSRLFAEHQGFLPRTRLRTGRSQGADGKTENQPFVDLARGIAVDVKDDGLPAPACGTTRLLTEVLAADPRNDDNVFIAQITVLFHRFHNLIIDLIEKGAPAVTAPGVAYGNFILARLVVAHVYRKIIVWDLLRRLLDPSVFRFYVIDRNSPIAAGKGVPIEFSYGAFRCGHAMVRDNYRVNSCDLKDTRNALPISSLRDPGRLPLTESWTVEWKRFFELAEKAPNYSRRLGPKYSAVVRNEGFFHPIDPGDAAGLPSRDLVSAVYAQLWSVPALIDELRRNPQIAAFLPSYSVCQQPLTDWLEAPSHGTAPYPFQAGDVAALAADPPLPFYVLFEAALTSASSTSPFVTGGQHLGPLGSIIVAETVLGAMSQAGIGIGSKPLDVWSEPIDQANALALLGLSPATIDGILDIRCMPDLLKFIGP